VTAPRPVPDARLVTTDGRERALRVVLLLGNPFTADSRSWKIARSLAERGHAVTVVARAGSGLPEDEVVDGARVLRLADPAHRRFGAPRLPGGVTGDARPQRGPAGRLRGAVSETLGRGLQALRYLRFTRARAGQVAGILQGADVWQAEGLVQLPVALDLRRRLGGVVVYDSRDLDVRSARFARLPAFWQRQLIARERRWARAADAIITANRPYAAAIEAATGRTPQIVWNGPVEVDGSRSRLAREVLGIPDDQAIALTLGQLAPDRGLGELCDAVGLVPHLALVIVGDGTLSGEIRARAARLPWADRIHLHPAVPPDQIPAWTRSADVAVMPIQGTTENHRSTTPTRLFDALGAGVPVVASRLPGMAGIVEETGCGVLCDPSDPESIAAAIREVLDAGPERRAALRSAALAAASGPYAWASQVDALLAVYASIGAGQRPGDHPV
jgi:glycosyltransferase involved in cell wall biosynthesis